MEPANPDLVSDSPPAEPAQATILECIENLGPKPMVTTDTTYVFRRTELDRMIEVDAPRPTDSASGVVNPYNDELTRRELVAEVEVVCKQFLEDFHYPVNRKGEPMDLRFLGPHIAWHLVRCGWRPINNRRMIKKIAIGAGPQRLDDAVAWVDISTPEEFDLDNMTTEELKAAPAHVRAEAIRRLDGDPQPPDPAKTDEEGRPEALGAKGHELWHQPWSLQTHNDPDFEELMTRHARKDKPK